MTSESNRISAASTAFVDRVCRAWGWSWNVVDQSDDDGLDGIIYLRKLNVNEENPNDRRSWTHSFTGGIISVQVKSGASYVVRSGVETVELRIKKLAEKREFWTKSPLPVALVYVLDGPEAAPNQAYWVDLKVATSYTAAGTILIPKKNRFQPGVECRAPFSRLASGQLRRLALDRVDMTLPGALPSKLDFRLPLKKAAREFYKQWRENPPSIAGLGPITVNRTGWAHITRQGRPVSRVLNSFELLPAAARLLSEVKSWKVLRRSNAVRVLDSHSWEVYDYLGVSAIVKWPARTASEVMVILRRRTTYIDNKIMSNGSTGTVFTKQEVWFYSVYEPGRRRNC
ncbi:DUF4365 domain-containing protein [Pseudorhodoferax sp. Leaf267]|uniref:DUF4365 domain-containing protein n=1 Tax=Pseudorhodoferax sp. Leaf267 TaxID=1736316 RepID=UPI0009E7F607|nr:DUF4365 domain-containing protein [Pseudorhodoferax sp. Leaf267]